MKRNKIVKAALSILIIGILLARILYVNANALKTSTEVYALGETVHLDGSFSQMAEENTAGYSLVVEKAEELSYEDYMLRYGKPQDFLAENSRKRTVLLTVKFMNQGNESGGVSTSRLFLFTQYLSAYFDVDSTYLAIANPQIEGDLWGVRIRPDTEYTIQFPFVLEYGPEPKSYFDTRKDGEKLIFYLMVSLYPVKKMIRIEI